MIETVLFGGLGLHGFLLGERHKQIDRPRKKLAGTFFLIKGHSKKIGTKGKREPGKSLLFSRWAKTSHEKTFLPAKKRAVFFSRRLLLRTGEVA